MMWSAHFWRSLMVALLIMGAGTASLAQPTNGFHSSVQMDDVHTQADTGGRASTQVGSSSGGMNSTVRVRGDISTKASDGRRASTTIGGQDGVTRTGGVNNNNSQIDVGGNTSVGGQIDGTDANVNIGGRYGGAHIDGDVTVRGANLEIGGACAGRVDGRCCWEFYWDKCVISRVPPHKGSCPPGYRHTGQWCRLFYRWSAVDVED